MFLRFQKAHKGAANWASSFNATCCGFYTFPRVQRQLSMQHFLHKIVNLNRRTKLRPTKSKKDYLSNSSTRTFIRWRCSGQRFSQNKKFQLQLHRIYEKKVTKIIFIFTVIIIFISYDYIFNAFLIHIFQIRHL